MDWQQVDEGWGRRATEAAYLFENMHWREYLYLLDQTGVGRGTRHLDTNDLGIARRHGTERKGEKRGRDLGRSVAGGVRAGQNSTGSDARNDRQRNRKRHEQSRREREPERAGQPRAFRLRAQCADLSEQAGYHSWTHVGGAPSIVVREVMQGRSQVTH